MIWCVEDDAAIRDIVIYTLKSVGFEAEGFEDGLSFWEALKAKQPDLILLDIMLPKIDGLKLLEKIKSNENLKNIPIIFSTAKGSEFDIVNGLDLGADDYLAKPYGMMEMVSRVKAVLRRSNKMDNKNVLSYKELKLFIDKRLVVIDDKKISLTYKEFELLKTFLLNANIVFTRDQLYSDIWGSDYIGETRTVDMHIRTLRQKLGSYATIIETVRNVGYRLGEIND